LCPAVSAPSRSGSTLEAAGGKSACQPLGTSLTSAFPKRTLAHYFERAGEVTRRWCPVSQSSFPPSLSVSARCPAHPGPYLEAVGLAQDSRQSEAKQLSQPKKWPGAPRPATSALHPFLTLRLMRSRGTSPEGPSTTYGSVERGPPRETRLLCPWSQFGRAPRHPSWSA
jgi:hypothetical protein